MIEVNNQSVEYVAELSKLEILPQETEEYKEDFRKILNYMETLETLDAEGTEPLSYAFDKENVLREDIVTQSDITEELLSNAPTVKGGCFVVPKTVE